VTPSFIYNGFTYKRHQNVPILRRILSVRGYHVKRALFSRPTSSLNDIENTFKLRR